jgi:hypothetical protein
MARFNMLHLDDFKIHRSWQDMVTAVLGVILIISPIWSEISLPPVASTSVFLVGAAMLCVALAEIMQISRFEELLQTAFGAWLAASVFILDYGGADTLRLWHFAIGASVAAIALFEYWQDSDKPL